MKLTFDGTLFSFRRDRTRYMAGEAELGFLEEVLLPIESVLTEHSLTLRYFQGHLKTIHGLDFEGIELDHGDGRPVEFLNSTESGRLLMVPDGHQLNELRRRDDGPVPEGKHFVSVGELIGITNSDVRPNGENAHLEVAPLQADEQQDGNLVVFYKSWQGTGLAVSALYIARLFYVPAAPSRLGTLAFAWMAVTAYRRGFSEINLFAAGHGPVGTTDFVGFDFWPKIGFDAEVSPARLSDEYALPVRTCTSIQEIRSQQPDWWPEYGWECDMSFDLRAGSRSWMVLLHYVYNTLIEEGFE